MIPLPPQDPALGPLGVALDGEAIADVLSRGLAECASGQLRIRSCRPTHVRYAPGESCRVEYKLSLRDRQTGARIKTRAHAWLLPGRRAARLASSRSVRRLVEAATRWHPEPPLDRAVYLPELRGVVQLFPVDSELPALALATSPGEMRLLLNRALGRRSGDDCQVELVRYKPGLRAVLRYRFADRDRQALYAKLYRHSANVEPTGAAQAILRSGVAIPPPLCYLSRLRMLVQAEARGRKLQDLRGSEDFDNWMSPVAATLARLHATRLAGLPGRSPTDLANSVLSAARLLGTLRPGFAGEASLLATRLAELLRQARAQQVTVHGDFTPLQVLVSEAGPILLDLDEIHRGHPMVDVGRFMAALAIDSTPNETTERTRDAFRGAYQAAAKHQRPDLAPLFEAAELLRGVLTPFRLLRPDWPAQTERLARLAAERLGDYEVALRERTAERRRVAARLEVGARVPW